MFFDAYSATIDSDRWPNEVINDTLRFELSEYLSRVESGKGMRNYHTSVDYFDHLGNLLMKCLSGGNPGSHLAVQGNYSPIVSDVIRSCFPDHRVSRCDAAFDLTGGGLYERLRDCFEVFAFQRGLSWQTLGDDRLDGMRDPDSNRTFYVGSRSSPCFLRCYEKGLKEVRFRRPEDPEIDLTWVRVELEIKPKDRGGKEALSRLEPDQCWGVSTWTKRASEEIFGMAVERRTIWERKEPDDYRAVRHMLTQYRGALSAVIRSEGGMRQFLIWARRVWKEHRPDLDEGWQP